MQLYKSYACLPLTGSGTSGAQRCATLAHQGQKRPKAARVSVLLFVYVISRTSARLPAKHQVRKGATGRRSPGCPVSGLDHYCGIVSGLLFQAHLRRSCVANQPAGCCPALPVGTFFYRQSGPARLHHRSGATACQLPAEHTKSNWATFTAAAPGSDPRSCSQLQGRATLMAVLQPTGRNVRSADCALRLLQAQSTEPQCGC